MQTNGMVKSNVARSGQPRENRTDSHSRLVDQTSSLTTLTRVANRMLSILDSCDVDVLNTPHIPHEKAPGKFRRLVQIPRSSCRTNTDRYGENFVDTSSISCGLIYLSLPPLAFNFATSRPRYAAIPRWTPRSPTEMISMRFSAKHANISTDHLPSPRTAVSFCMISSSEASASIFAVNSPFANFSARPLTYSAFRSDNPACRSRGMSVSAT